jgi:hypothetical protein
VQLGGERVLLEDLRVGPAFGPIEFRDREARRGRRISCRNLLDPDL